ncbi:MAG: phosphosulfolactate synthase [Halanaerobiaceae bacterium]
MSYNWGIDIDCPISKREEKPRSEGLTMVLDKGLGLLSLRNLIETAGQYIDLIKLSFGSSFLYPEKILRKKIKLAGEHKIDIFPGGTLFEIALAQDKVNEYFFRAQQLGFTAIEISSGTLNFSSPKREQVIKKAKNFEFKVLTEVGKKSRSRELSWAEFSRQVRKDLDWDSDLVIIEGRESGKGISIYDKQGGVNKMKLGAILKENGSAKNQIMWETPLKKQQVYFIKQFGPQINLGNISPDEVLALESLRRGLRGDTFALTLNQQQKENIIQSNK